MAASVSYPQKSARYAGQPRRTTSTRVRSFSWTSLHTRVDEPIPAKRTAVWITFPPAGCPSGKTTRPGAVAQPEQEAHPCGKKNWPAATFS